MSFSNTGRIWDLPGLKDALESATMTWASSVTFHHTAMPDLGMRPRGFTAEHMSNIRHYYEGEKGWSAGPHLFVDEDQYFGMTPFSERGVHAVSFNGTSVGIEVLGNYDEEDPLTGRGLACWKMAAAAGAAVLSRLGVPVSKASVKFHRDDPKTKKSCPGRRVTKEWIIGLMENAESPAPDADDLRKSVLERVGHIEWQLKKLKENLA